MKTPIALAGLLWIGASCASTDPAVSSVDLATEPVVARLDIGGVT